MGGDRSVAHMGTVSNVASTNIVPATIFLTVITLYSN
jgi:hypothetical protein